MPSENSSAGCGLPTRTVNGTRDNDPWLVTSSTKLITLPHATDCATLNVNGDKPPALCPGAMLGKSDAPPVTVTPLVVVVNVPCADVNATGERLPTLMLIETVSPGSAKPSAPPASVTLATDAIVTSLRSP